MRTRSMAWLVVLTAAASCWAVLPAAAQQSQKRSEVELLPVGPPKESTPTVWGLYDFENSLEIGGQFVDRHGNLGVYRSQLNYTSGGRLFGFSLRGKARDSGAFLTRMYMEGGGWGGDPYNWFRYGFSKDRWFDFRADYLRSDYFFVRPGWDRNQRANDQQRRRQNFELTLFPQRKVRVRLGYSRNSSFGLALTTFDFSRDEFAFFEPLRQTYDEYKLGADWSLGRWNFFFDYSYRFFRNDRFLNLVTPPNPNPGNTITGTTFLNSVERAYPGRGRVPFVRFTVSGRPYRTLDVSARVVYSQAKFRFTRSETDDGRTFDPPGPTPAQLIVDTLDSVGRVTRPNTLADVAVSWRPIPKLTVSNTFRFNGFNIAGNDLTNAFSTCNPNNTTSACNPGPRGEDLTHPFTVHYFVNRFEARYDVTPWLGLRAGHRHTHRSAVLTETELTCANAFLPGCTGGTLTFTNERTAATRVANTALLGGDLRLHKTFKLFVDWERGGIDSVFNRIRRGHRLTARVRTQWEPVAGVRVGASWVQLDQRAPSPDVDSNQHNRGFTVDFALTKWERFYWDIGYSRNDVNSFTQIGRRVSATVFALVDGPTGIDCSGTLVPGQWTVPGYNIRCRPSTYIDNSNYAYFDLGGRLVQRLSGEIGYRIFTATGTYAPSDPEGICPNVYFGPCNAYASSPGLTVVRAQWGGFNFHQPHAMLHYAFNDNVSVKGSWRWYGYNVKFGTFTDYKAHIGTVSLLLRF